MYTTKLSFEGSPSYNNSVPNCFNFGVLENVKAVCGKQKKIDIMGDNCFQFEK